MEEWETAGYPVLRYLAVARAARDFGLAGAALEALALRCGPGYGSLEEFTAAVTAALLERSAVPRALSP